MHVQYCVYVVVLMNRKARNKAINQATQYGDVCIRCGVPALPLNDLTTVCHMNRVEEQILRWRQEWTMLYGKHDCLTLSLM